MKVIFNHCGTDDNAATLELISLDEDDTKLLKELINKGFVAVHTLDKCKSPESVTIKISR